MALFTKKELGLLLPDDNPGDPVSLRHTKTTEETEQFKELKPKVDPSTKVRRYRAGQVPEFAAGYEEERGFVTASHQVRGQKKAPAADVAPLRKRFEAQVVSKAAPTRPLQPRPRKTSDASDDDSLADTSAKPRGSGLDDSSSEDEDEEIDRRRQALRRKMLEKENAVESRPLVEAKIVRVSSEPSKSILLEPTKAISRTPSAQRVETESSADSESGSEWETDTDASDDGEVLMKPVFVPKKARGTIKQQEEIEAEEQRRQQKEIEKAKARKEESRKLVVEELQREKDGDQADVTDTEMPDDTDGVDPEQEYRDWELREMRRMKRDRDRRAQRQKEAEEVLRRRNLTDEERQAEDEKLKKNLPKEKTKLKFLQKYYHKGAFYMDDSSIQSKDDVRKRAATGATLEDKFNKEMLPQVMQVKNFGKSGRTKYTHLAAEDTSSKESLWSRDDSIRGKFASRLSGTRSVDNHANKKRKTS